MEDKPTNEKEVAAGIEFNKEQPIEAPAQEVKQAPKKMTETAGGVEFEKAQEKKAEAPAEPKPRKISDDAIHTMAEDMGEQAEHKQGSALQTLLKQERLAREERKRQQKNMVFGLISVVLIVAAVGLIMYANREDETVAPAPTQVVQQSLVFAENHTRIDTTGIQPLTLLSNISSKVRNGESTPDEVTNIYFTRDLPAGGVQTLNTRQFLSAIQSSAPGSLLPYLGKDFMLGVFAGDTRKPFLALSSSSGVSLNHMRGWESTILQEVARVFGMDITDPDLYAKEFVDHQILNKNMRVLFDDAGEFVLGYSYINEEMLVIVTEGITFEEILQRLATNF